MDYEELGFKCGIEIHQQLGTKTKLFCECPIDLEDEEHDHNFERFLRSVVGETGEKDKAAEYEEKKKRKYVYNYYKRNNCLVELDEEPPHSMNQEALNVGLTFARMVDADIPDEIQVMRKMVVDGSNTSGFQRTAMIALDGEIETSRGKVNIEDIELEEESAGIHKKTKNKSIYDLNRLGIPLIEVGTDATIKNPQHAREVAKQIGMLLRSTQKVRRGIGTIRQDVNVSIENGARVEIKGFQDVENIDKLIENEVKRQKNLLEIGNSLETSIKEDLEFRDVTEVFKDTDNSIISTILENKGKVYAIKLPALEGKMKKNISGDRYLAKELVDYAKSQGVKGMMHTDEEIEKYDLEEEFQALNNNLDKKEGEVVALIAAEQEKAKNAIQAVKNRAKKLYAGEIPEETRNAEQNFTTTYLRPLPGSARMYPETDVPPIQISQNKIDEIDQELPETLEEKEERYKEEIGGQLAEQIVKSDKLSLFERYKDLTEAKIVANTFTNTFSKLEDENVQLENLTEECYTKLFEGVEKGSIKKGDIEEVLKSMSENPKKPEQAIQDVLDNKTSEDEIRSVVKTVIEENTGLIEEQGEHAQGALMGMVMKEVDADGGTVSKILSEEMGKKLG